jgi:tight adherence protein B
MSPIAIVLALVVFAGVVLLFIGLSQTLTQESELEQRLGAARGYAVAVADPTVEGEPGGGGGQSGGMASVVEQALSKRPGSDKTRELLGRADLKLTVGEYTMIRGGTAVIGAGVGFLAGVTNSLIVGFPIPFVFAGAFLGWMAPRIYAGKRASGRLAAFNNQLADTIALLANALRSGNFVAQAMALASREAPPPPARNSPAWCRRWAWAFRPRTLSRTWSSGCPAKTST